MILKNLQGQKSFQWETGFVIRTGKCLFDLQYNRPVQNVITVRVLTKAGGQPESSAFTT